MSHSRLKIIGAVVALAMVAAGLSQINGATDQRVFVVPTDDARLKVNVIFPNPPATPGLAHYTEHLAWLNAVSANARTADRHSNAWTSSHAIGYWLSGTSADLPELVGTLSRLFDPITLPDAFAAQERGIVLREYELRLAGNDDAKAAERMNAFLYDGNALGASVLGTPEQIRGFDYDAGRAFHALTHRRELATVIVTGDVTARQAHRALRDFDLPPATPMTPLPFSVGAPANTLFQMPDSAAAPRLVSRKVIALDEPMQFDLLEAHASLLSDILESNVVGGLAGPLRFDAAIARGFNVGVWPIDEGHIEIGFWASPDRGVSLSELQDAYDDTFADIAAAGIPQGTYARILARFDGFWPDWNDPDETSEWMAGYVMNRVSTVREPLAVQEVKGLKSELSLDTINALLRQLNQEGRRAGVFIGPQETFE